MPDSTIVRQQRFRAHKAGDHSLCNPARCAAAREAGVPEKPPAPRAEPAQRADPAPSVAAPKSAKQPKPSPDDVEVAPPGGIEVAVAAYVGSLKFKAGDPRAILGEIAIRLAKRVDESGALPAAVRELRVLLAQIGEIPNAEAGPVDELRVQRTQRRIGQLLSQVG